jgi:hypothetical protein
MPASRPSQLIVLAFVFASAAGCSRATRTASVSGIVTLDNNPPNVRLLLSFVGADNVPRSVETDETGHFSLSDLPVGDVAVMVSTAGGCGSARPREGRHGAGSPGAGSPRDAGRDQSSAGPNVPAGYSDATNPRLRYRLDGESTTLTIELTTARK